MYDDIHHRFKDDRMMTCIIKIKKIYCHRLKRSENGQPAAVPHVVTNNLLAF
jgi:hypothetical protein